MGVGKTTAAAVCVLWFLDTRPDSRVISSAVTFAQVEAVLWAELRRLWHDAASRPAARSRPVFTVEPLRTRHELPDGRYALGLSPDPHRVEGFQGHHAPNILLLIDEASGVHQSIFDAGTGYMTTAGARLLLLGNPTRPDGEFYAAFHHRRDSYNPIVISALDSPGITGEEVPQTVRDRLPSRESIEDYRRMYGEGSVMWDVRVLGQFPRQSSDAVISLGDVEDAQARELEPHFNDRVVVGCDVARYGSDETVIAVRFGQRVRIVERYVGKPTTHTAARIVHHYAQYPAPHTRIVVDDVGVGGGVTDQLRAEGLEVAAFNAGAQAHNHLKFPNRRSELWFQLAAQLPDLDLDPDEQLAADLTAPKYSYDLKMRQVVEAKDHTKRRLGRSPDRADAVMLTLVEAPAMVVPDRGGVEPMLTAGLRDRPL